MSGSKMHKATSFKYKKAQLDKKSDSKHESDLKSATKSLAKDLKANFKNSRTHKGQKISYGVIDFKPSYAKLLLNANRPNNRSIGKVNLVKIKQAMRDGNFISLNGQNIILGVAKDGSIELLDGQHRMQAIVDTNVSLPFQTTLIHNVNDDIFLTMDSGKSRNPKDFFKITNRQPALCTTVRVAYGYQTMERRIDMVAATAHSLATYYDKHPKLLKLYDRTKGLIKNGNAGQNTSADKLFFDQAIFFALYMIENNFGSNGKMFVNALTCFDHTKFDDIGTMTSTQKRCIKHIHWLFNGLNRGFDDQRCQHNINLATASDTRKKRNCKSVVLTIAFLEHFIKDIPFNKRSSINIIKDPSVLLSWPDLGQFEV